jgi:antitoxin ParD1/3/4
MVRRTASPMTVTLPSGQKAFVEDRIRLGRFASASEVVREGLRALEREETHLDEWMREKIRAAREDSRPSVPAEEVLGRLNARIAAAEESGD